MTPTRWLLVAALLALPRGVRADVPPPSGYVETCTVQQQSRAGARCQACSSWHGAAAEHTDCPTRFAGTPLTKRCQSWGASTWTEVWCDGPAPPPPAQTATTAGPTAPATTARRGCATTGSADTAWAAALVAGVLGALAAARARRRR